MIVAKEPLNIVIQGMKKEIEGLMLKIEENVKRNQSVEKELEELGQTFGDQKLVKVFEIIENRRIIKIRSIKSGRELFQVNGNPDQNGCKSISLLFPGLPYCTCFSFGRLVIRKEVLLCKHHVAVRLAIALSEEIETLELGPEEFNAKIKLIKI